MTEPGVEESQLDLAAFTSELSQVYEPIQDEMHALNEFLSAEFCSPEPFIHELLMHISHFHGKQIRPACLLLAGESIGGMTKGHIKSAAVVELIHTATLVHDDLLDDATLRRRVETVNARWGERAAVLLGDFIYSRGFSISTEVRGVSRLLADTTHQICAGELLQISTAFDTSLTEERYYEIIRKKTAILYGMACQVGGKLSGATRTQQKHLEEFGTSLGMAFQISDDALDLVGDEKVIGKSLGTDLRKGKLTLPLIQLRERLTGGKLEEYMWLLQHPTAVGTQQRILGMLGDYDILKGVRESAAGYVQRAVALLDLFSESRVRHSFERLADFILARQL
ncbi:MAG: polyprenyl synthetase family protein [Planctomycetota bacterium]